jgi:hypothetical protein
MPVGAPQVSNYDALITTRLAKDVMAREPQWTESIAVGSRVFVEAIGQAVNRRQRLSYSPVGEDLWLLGENLPMPFREMA